MLTLFSPQVGAPRPIVAISNAEGRSGFVHYAYTVDIYVVASDMGYNNNRCVHWVRLSALAKSILAT
jgi:hypothetical protein